MNDPTPYEPGGDMTDGVTRAHVEAAAEIAATPTDIEVEMPRCIACDATGESLLNPCPNTDNGEHSRSTELPRSWQPERTDLDEPDEPPAPGNRHRWPHAKVALLMVSVGGEDAARSYEDFVRDAKLALLGDQRGVKAVTETGGYYIVNGRVCLPQDYDPATRDFKPGATPPQWAGGPGGNPAKPARRETPVPTGLSAEDTVRTLAEGMNREVRGD